MKALFARLLGRPTVVEAEVAARGVADLILDADDCWRDVCRLRFYDVPGTVATCEMAFARTGLLKAIVWRRYDRPIAERMRKSVDAALLECFSSQDTGETRAHYRRPLRDAVLLRTSFYTNSAMTVGSVAAELGEELNVPGPWNIEIGPLFTAVEHRITAMLDKIEVR